MSLANTHRKRKNIRDRVYVREQLPHGVYEGRLVCEGAADRTILDVGCGRQAMALRRVAHAYRYAIGLDMEASQGSDIPAGIQLIESDAHSIPLPDSSVHVVAMAHVVGSSSSPSIPGFHRSPWPAYYRIDCASS